jgi:hypothetical protein
LRVAASSMPLGFPVSGLLCLGLGHELAILRAAIPASVLVINAGLKVYPNLTRSLCSRYFCESELLFGDELAEAELA